jgi:tRNA-dihydrouridine synthase 2
MGCARPETGIEAGKIVVNDVSGIDVNMGCPKHFSL